MLYLIYPGNWFCQNDHIFDTFRLYLEYTGNLFGFGGNDPTLGFIRYFRILWVDHGIARCAKYDDTSLSSLRGFPSCCKQSTTSKHYIYQLCTSWTVTSAQGNAKSGVVLSTVLPKMLGVHLQKSLYNQNSDIQQNHCYNKFHHLGVIVRRVTGNLELGFGIGGKLFARSSQGSSSFGRINSSNGGRLHGHINADWWPNSLLDDDEAYPDVDLDVSLDVSSFKGILSPSLRWKCFTHGRSENTRPEDR